jgi:Transposase and inactivated derivatives
MSQIETIKNMQSKGLGPSAIAERLQMDRKTVRKVMKAETFENRKPKAAVAQPSKLDPYKPLIQSWLEEDRKNRYKQRHTAQRIHNRLVAEYPGYDASYPLVQRYVRNLREARHQEGTLELEWPPGEAQVDFGEADIFDADGEKKACKFLCVTFPYSNAGYTQLFGGETAECVVHGLRDIFHRIGGVPGRLIFDNASGVGRRVNENVQMADLFLRFKAHYGFEVTFCNPYAGHERGNVENKVGFRRNFFVPLPTVTDIQNALLYLSRHPFAACRYARVKTDGYGKFSIDGKHFYSSSPEWAGREVTVRIGAHTVEPLLPSGEPITIHLRLFGKQRTDSVDVRTTLSRLLQNPGAWRNSQLRKAIPDLLREELDKLERTELKETLATMEQLSGRYGSTPPCRPWRKRPSSDGLRVRTASCLPPGWPRLSRKKAQVSI